MEHADQDFLLTAAEVAKRLGIGISTVWAMAARGDLPRPVKLGIRCSRWRASDIAKLIHADKVAA